MEAVPGHRLHYLRPCPLEIDHGGGENRPQFALLPAYVPAELKAVTPEQLRELPLHKRAAPISSVELLGLGVGAKLLELLFMAVDGDRAASLGARARASELEVVAGLGRKSVAIDQPPLVVAPLGRGARGRSSRTGVLFKIDVERAF